MNISMYSASVPVFERMLKNLAAILAKAEQYAATRKIDPSVLINARLYPDMLPLSAQVQIAADAAKGAAARLSGSEIPSFPDTETSFAELQERIAKTLAYLSTFKPAQFDGSEERAIELKTPTRTLNFKGEQFLLNFAMANFYFHITTTYAILRHNGVEVGKMDYIGGV